ncbi:PIN domain-containing protein [Hymenobacter tibetensis]|uniref:PIN domain-containing protein n=1 Tax=Hymenobacter tibetensis TaxID=497967 RepID=A0ABY4D2G4_9BACT|nr:PIN domain-containing protein [Hymenobacter tibetensis]UOG76731.1 PIN domain-containing protein [Hymenobacter tibetensis]
MAKIFFDTAPFIYLVENHATYYQKVADYLTQSLTDNAMLETSVLTYTEFCAKPEQLGRPDLLLDFDELLRDFDFQMREICLAVATLAYQLQARYAGLKGIDAMQIATAVNAGCNIFLTNDRELKNIREIQVVVVADL